MAFTDKDIEVFGRYLTFCGIGIQNAQLFEMSVQEYRRNQILLNLARSIFEEQNNLECLVTKILTEARGLLKCQRCAVFLLDLDCCESVSLRTQNRPQHHHCLTWCIFVALGFFHLSFTLINMKMAHFRKKPSMRGWWNEWVDVDKAKGKKVNVAMCPTSNTYQHNPTGMIMLLCEEWHRRTSQDTIGKGEEISKVSHSNHVALRMFTHANTRSRVLCLQNLTIYTEQTNNKHTTEDKTHAPT